MFKIFRNNLSIKKNKISLDKKDHIKDEDNEEIERILIHYPEVIEQVFDPSKGDLNGVKHLIRMFPQQLKLSDEMRKGVLQFGDYLDDHQFKIWNDDFISRAVSLLARQGKEYGHKKKDTSLLEVLELSNIDICILLDKNDDFYFKKFLYRHLSIERLGVIFDNDAMNSLIESESSFKLSSLQEKAFYILYQNQKEESKNYTIPRKKKEFLSQVLSFSQDSYVADLFNSKSPYEVSLIMLELNHENRLLIFNVLSDEKKKKVSRLFIGGRQELRDGRYFERFIKEVEQHYFEGHFRLSNFNEL